MQKVGTAYVLCTRLNVASGKSQRVAAPLDASIDAIEIRLRRRAAWIMRQQRYFSQFLPRTPERLFISGETHLYLGRQYRLKVVPHVQAGVKLTRGFIVVQTHRPNSSEVTRELVDAWYRERAHGLVAVWCRSFDSVMCSKGDEAWAQSGRMNFARMRCGSR